MKLLEIDITRRVTNPALGTDKRRPLVGIIRVQELLVNGIERALDERGSLPVDRAVAGAAELGVGLDSLATPRAGLGRDRVGRLLTDVDTVGARNLAVGVLAKHLDVAGGRITAPHPAVMVLDVGLVDVPAGEVRGRGLPEVRQRDGLINARALRAGVELLVEQPVADRLGGAELRPQWVAAVGAGMGREPVRDVRRRRHQEHRPPALLSLDRDLQPVVVVLDVAARERFELAPTEPGVELERDHRRVAVVPGGAEHRLDVLLPEQHVSGVGRRVVVIRVGGRYPRDALGWVVAVGDGRAELPEHNAVVPVGLLVGVLVVEPLLQLLGGVTVSERGRERDRPALRHDAGVAEALLEPILAEALWNPQLEPVGVLGEELLVRIGHAVAIVDAVAECRDLRVEIGGHAPLVSLTHQKGVAVNLWYTAHPWLIPNCSKPRVNNGQSAASSGGVAA